MHFQHLSILAAMAASAVALPKAEPVAFDEASMGTSVEKRAVQCAGPGGVVVFIVRGSDPNHNNLNDDPAYAQTNPHMMNIAYAARDQAGDGSYIQAIPYPAKNPPANYGQSVNIGVEHLQDHMYDYVNSCSTGQIVLVGYSQGAQVVTGALSGVPYVRTGFGLGQNNNQRRVLTATVVADPSYCDGNNNIDAGSANNNGRSGDQCGTDPKKYPHLNTWYNGRLKSFCQAGDQFCDNSGQNNGIHLDAPNHFQQQAVNFNAGNIARYKGN